VIGCVTVAQPFGAAKPAFGGLTTSTAAPSFNFGANLNTGASLFGNPGLSKPGGFGLGTTQTAGTICYTGLDMLLNSYR